MPTIHVDPSGTEFQIPGAAPILFEAQVAGYSWPTICGGKGTCRTCFLRIGPDGGRLSSMESGEAESLAMLGLVPEPGERLRLACQAIALNDVTVYRPGVHPLEPSQVLTEPDNVKRATRD